jgi:hypothetical protein
MRQRTRGQQALAALSSGDEREEVMDRAAKFLNDEPSAWAAASNEQRNAFARLLFEDVRIKDDWVRAIQPQPSFMPFFKLEYQARRLSSGSDGIRTRGLSLDRAAC